MTWRAAAHDYTWAGVYHITIRVADELGQPLGKVVGDISAPDGSANAPRTALSPIGQMVEQELLHTIHAYYPMIVVDTYAIMPEHLHFILEVQDRIVSQNGKVQSLGQVIAGFKKGCNKRYWEIAGISSGETIMQRAKPDATLIKEDLTATAGSVPASGNPHIIPGSVSAVGNPHIIPGSVPAGGNPYIIPGSVSAGFAGGKPRFSTGRQPLFNPGYCDVMPVDAQQLATQRAYIAANPRSRLLRTGNRAMLMPQRGTINTAITLAALRGFLMRECAPRFITQEALSQIEPRLLLAGGMVICDSYGNRTLLSEKRCLPVVCHRKDANRFSEQKQHCLEEAEHGTVLVSARIAKGEQEIMDEAQHRGHPVVLIADNGFPEVYHPSAERIEQCAMGKLLIVTPWQYQYRKKDETVSVPFCKTMNCVSQALCRTKDNWWKNK